MATSLDTTVGTTMVTVTCRTIPVIMAMITGTVPAVTSTR